MKSPGTMTDERLRHWAAKTSATLSKNFYTCGESKRYELIDRYTDIKEEMQSRGTWDTYCEQSGFSTSHDAWDCTA